MCAAGIASYHQFTDHIHPPVRGHIPAHNEPLTYIDIARTDCTDTLTAYIGHWALK